MKNKKSKEDLIELVEDLQNKVEILENDVEFWQRNYEDLTVEHNDLYDEFIKTKSGITNIDNFKFELLKSDLLNDELEKFISNYLKYYND